MILGVIGNDLWRLPHILAAMDCLRSLVLFVLFFCGRTFLKLLFFPLSFLPTLISSLFARRRLYARQHGLTRLTRRLLIEEGLKDMLPDPLLRYSFLAATAALSPALHGHPHTPCKH